MIINKQNYEDFKKYYQGCWIKLRECGERIYLLKEVGPDFSYLHSTSRGPEDEYADARIDMSIDYHVDYVLPKKTTFQHGETAVLLQRIPARMWKKGMDVKNTEFLMLGSEGEWKKIPLDMGIIEGFINKPSYYTWEDAQTNFKGALLSAALSPRISVTKTGMVFIDNNFVARYQELKKTLIYKAIYGPELTKVITNVLYKAV